jgi:hypothetical protein
MKFKLTALIAVVLAMFAITASAAPRLFAVNPFTNDNTASDRFGLYEIDPANAAVVASAVITVPSRTITGANGLALDPTTGTAFAIVKATGVTGRLLITINLSTGVGTEIGDLGDNFSSLAFRPDGQLLGATGNGATSPETLYLINKATAATTLAFAMGNGADGEVIVYNPTDANLYHFSGNSTIVFEKWPTTNVAYTPTNIALSGAAPGGEVFGAVWDPAQSVFLTSHIDSQLRTITPTGTVSTPLGALPNDLRGMILLLDQAISGFAPASPVVFGALPATLTATGGSSGNPVVFATTSLATICTVSGNTVTFVGVGVCNLTANQAAGGIYTAAPQVTSSITIDPAPQAISGFTPVTPVVFGAVPATLAATGGASGSPIVFATTSLATVCTVSGNVVTFVGVGVCNLTANQAAAGNYSAAPEVTASISIGAAAAAITGFSLPAALTLGSAPITLSAIGAPSGAPIVFATTSPASVCTVTGNTLLITGVGTCVVTANQAAAGNFAAAPEVTAIIVIVAAAAYEVPTLYTSLLILLASLVIGVGMWHRRFHARA